MRFNNCRLDANLLFSYQFLPCVGGVQVVSATLASTWTEMGHQTTVVTRTPLENHPEFDRQFSFPVVRLSNAMKEVRRQWKPILDQTDLIVCNCVSLKYWPLWVWRRKPIVFIHQLFLGQDPTGEDVSAIESMRRRFRLSSRRALLRRAAGNVFITQYIRQVVGISGGIAIYNPIDDCFRPLPGAAPTADFAYFGRMSFEKGVTDLLDALQLCNTKGHRFTLDLYGEGWYLEKFQEHAARLQLDNQLRWLPFLRGEELVRAMNSAAVVIVPSKWIEPMGIVAAEAMACGKCVIGSSLGGLGEVLNGYCPTYPNHDTEQLAKHMIAILTDPELHRRNEAAACAPSEGISAAE